MSNILKAFKGSKDKEIVSQFIPDKEYPLFVHMCGTSECSPQYKVSRGITHFYTIEHIIQGKGYVQENDRICYPQAGDSHIFHPGSNQTFFTDPANPWVKLWVIFSGPCADSLFEIYKLNEQLHFPNLNLYEPLKKIIDICNTEIPTDEKMSKCSVIIMEMVQQLYLYKERNNLEQKSLSTAGKLKTIIDTMWKFDVSLDELAAQVYCSRNHAIRLFKSEFGISPYKYISNIRLKNSKRMLRSSNLPVGEIAKSMGFCDSRYFSNWFKKHTGISPKDYRTLTQSKTGDDVN